LVDSTSGHPPSAVSIAAHILPASLSAFALWPRTPNWLASVGPAWALFLAAQGLSVAVADPSLNINVVWSAQPPFDRWFTTPWSARLFHSLASLGCLVVAALVLRLASTLTGRVAPATSSR
jgi:hypothetical protein